MAKVLLTGLTSFTGAYISKALVEAGHQVVGVLTRDRSTYKQETLLEKRIAFSKVEDFVVQAPFGSANFLAALATGFDVLINHGASIAGYRDPSFDYLNSVQTSLLNARQVFEAGAKNGLRLVVHSGSFFEPNEGSEDVGKDGSSPGLSIYGVSKAMVWQPIRYWSEAAGVRTAKIVIPNPIGAFENPDRMAPLFVQKWMRGETPVLRTPRLLRDHLPASWLARVYADEVATGLASGRPTSDTPPSIRRPSGFIMRNLEFVEELSKQINKSGWPIKCSFRVEEVKSNEAAERFNSEAAAELRNAQEQRLFWDSWITGLREAASNTA